MEGGGWLEGEGGEVIHGFVTVAACTWVCVQSCIFKLLIFIYIILNTIYI